MEVAELLALLGNDPDKVRFEDVISVIDDNYLFTPSRFSNGNLVNNAGENSGSCKIFSFARLHNLSQQQTLNCFGDYYRVDVLQHPHNDDHQNIRNFMKTGWPGVRFDNNALTSRT